MAHLSNEKHPSEASCFDLIPQWIHGEGLVSSQTSNPDPIAFFVCVLLIVAANISVNSDLKLFLNPEELMEESKLCMHLIIVDAQESRWVTGCGQENYQPIPLKLRKLICPEGLWSFILWALDMGVWLLGSIHWGMLVLSFWVWFFSALLLAWTRVTR